jgi:hypothetical protein
VGIFHFVFRKKFMAISFDPVKAYDSGIRVRLWDFLFYMSFGFVITSSVAIAGVFLVFSYLVIPSVGAMLISEKLGKRLAAGWIGGSIISFIGVKLSWNTGLPTSPLIVVLFAAALIASGMYAYIAQAERKGIALRNLAGSLIIVLLFIGGMYFFRKPVEDPLSHALHRLESPIGTDRQTALTDLQLYLDKQSDWYAPVLGRLNDSDAEVRNAAVKLLSMSGNPSALSHILPLLNDRSDVVREGSLEAIGRIGGPSSAKALVDHAATEDDPEFQVTLLATALSMGDRSAVPLLAGIATGESLFSDDAWSALCKHIDPSVKTLKPPEFKSWWERNSQKLSWDTTARAFLLPKQ